MDNYAPTTTDQFIAPLLPGRNTWIQQYFQLSRWLTIPTIVLVGLIMIWLLKDVSRVWLVIVIVGIPINFIGFHLLAARAFANIDLAGRHEHKMIIDAQKVHVIYPEKNDERFQFKDLENIKLIYSGYERAFFPSGKYFNGAQNQLIFQFRGRKISLRFRLISKKHFREMQNMLADWYEAGIDFEEFSRTSGLPVKTQMLEIH